MLDCSLIALSLHFKEIIDFFDIQIVTFSDICGAID